MSSADLADELEVARRTILRDVDAMTEAGLPIIVHRGNQGGIELGFNYRTRLTGLAADEAEAMAVILFHPMAELKQIGLHKAADRARSKLLESFPDGVRDRVQQAKQRFQFHDDEAVDTDPRIPALAKAVRGSNIVRIRARSSAPQTIHPVGLICRKSNWCVVDAHDPDDPIPLSDCHDLNISSKTFEAS